MNREIRFRGKPVSKQFGEWVEGYYLKDLDNGQAKHYIFSCPMRVEVIPETVSQFILLKDKNHKDIYEGDILRMENPDEEESWISEVRRFGEVDYSSNDYDYILLDWVDDHIEYEIIGNIHDNPSLFK